MESKLRRNPSRGHVMRTTKRGQKVVERVIVRKVDQRHLRAPSVSVPLEEVVIANCQIKKIAVRDAWRQANGAGPVLRQPNRLQRAALRRAKA